MSLSAPLIKSKRERDESLHYYRSEFERDRDRILYSKAFRRLNGKTQIFLPLSHDHVRNRLTHTLEVSQIAKVTSKNLNLDVDLSEAIALGHDIGHTPFGHIGERTLNMITNNCDMLHLLLSKMDEKHKGFKHNLHGLRVACHLEKSNKQYPGMNLTNFTLWGIQNHSRTTWTKTDPKTGEILKCDHFNRGECFFHLKPNICPVPFLSVEFYNQYVPFTLIDKNKKAAWSFEGFVVALSDEIAQRHHDVEDAIFMKIVSLNELKERINEYFRPHFDDEDKINFKRLNREKNEAYFLPLISRFIVNILNKNLIENSKRKLNKLIDKYSFKSTNEFVNNYEKIDFKDCEECINFAAYFKEAHDEFQKFLRDRILNSFEVQRMDGRGTYIIKKLIKAYLTNPQQLSDATLVYIENIFRKRTTGRKAVEDLSPLEIGKLRSEINDLSKRASSSFQIDLLRGICDHIAGMTDNYAISEFKRLYGHI